jgi:hypothetical protein
MKQFARINLATCLRTRAKRIQKSTDKKRGRLQEQCPEDAPLLNARTPTKPPNAGKTHPEID